MFKNLEKLNSNKIALLQASGIALYITLIAFFIRNLSNWFGKGPDTILAPLLMITLFSISVLICGFITLGYPIYLFWVKKEQSDAIRLVAYTTKWLILFFFVILALLFATK